MSQNSYKIKEIPRLAIKLVLKSGKNEKIQRRVVDVPMLSFNNLSGRKRQLPELINQGNELVFGIKL